jgi:hypothetical protein
MPPNHTHTLALLLQTDHSLVRFANCSWDDELGFVENLSLEEFTSLAVCDGVDYEFEGQILVSFASAKGEVGFWHRYQG